MKRITRLALAAGLVMAGLPALADDNADLIAKGKYVAQAADCDACHTAPVKGAEYMAGGYPFEMPMGKIISSNITSSKEFGIGDWTEEEFARAVRKGVVPGGRRLYPAMPYTSYGEITDEDMKALYAYFQSVPAVDHAPAEKTELKFPFNIPGAMIGWNLLFANAKPFTPDPALNEEQNRGKYLVDGLAHCSTCHTPRNQLMAEKKSAYLGGTDVEGWHAPNLTSDKVSGLGGWTDAQIESYLKNGHAAGVAQAAGPMAEAVEHSLRFLKDSDVKAITAYLRTIPAIHEEGETTPDYGVSQAKPVSLDTYETGMVANDQPGYRATDDTDGGHLYNAACAACHGINGQGTEDGHFPSLTNNSVVGSTSHANLVQAIVQGVHRTGADGRWVMPAFGEGIQQIHDPLTKAQIASVANYVTANFGKGDAGLTADDIAAIEKGAPPPWLISHANTLFWIGVAVVIVVLLIILGWYFGSRRRRR